ncbi:MAG: Rieske (2Fe-2S) protein [Haloferacaceae archaeon]
MSGTPIAPVDEIPADSTLLVTLLDADGNEREAVLVRTDDGVRAWLNYCQHLAHVTLDKGSGSEMRNGEMICTNHGAYFESDTGLCTHGPCEGAYLASVAVTVDDGTVHLADDGYEFVRRGGIETDPVDLSSTSNVEF